MWCYLLDCNHGDVAERRAVTNKRGDSSSMVQEEEQREEVEGEDEGEEGEEREVEVKEKEEQKYD